MPLCACNFACVLVKTALRFEKSSAVMAASSNSGATREICSLYAQRLAHAQVCSLKLDNLTFTGCPQDGGVRGKTCGMTEQCLFSKDHSIRIGDGFASAYTCQRSYHRIFLLAIGGGLIALGIAIFLYATVVRPQLQASSQLRKEQDLVRQYQRLRKVAMRQANSAHSPPPAAT